MGVIRGLVALVTLELLAAVGGHAAYAAPRVHRTTAGRYLQELCDDSQPLRCMAMRVLPERWSPGNPIPEGDPSVAPFAKGAPLAPSDIVAAYDIPAASSAHGRIVAVLDSPDAYAASDLAAYRAHYKLPALPTCEGKPNGTTPCFAAVAEDGSASTGEDSGCSEASCPDGETSLDMDMVSAACPDCSIVLVELTKLTTSDVRVAVKTAAALGASAISISLGGPENTDPTCIGKGCGLHDPTGYTTPGHLVLAAAGDFGYLLGGDAASSPSYPASAPDVIAVGGTALFAKEGGRYDEAVWNDGRFGSAQDVTTSGCSTEFATPSWQVAALAGSGCSKRGTADIAAAAAFYDANGATAGIEIYVAGAGGFMLVEGTSASAPLLAGLLTRLGLTDAMSSDLSWEYTNASAFNDLGGPAYPVDPNGEGTNASGTSCGILCTAAKGWDGPSGVGTPNGTKLATLAVASAFDGADGGEATGATPAEDAGQVAADSDGIPTAGAPLRGQCACSTPGGSDPVQDVGAILLVCGAIAAGSSRRRLGGAQERPRHDRW